MTLFAATPSLTRSDWADAKEIVELRLSGWLRTDNKGKQYLDPNNTPGPLARLYDEIVRVGLEREWITPNEGDN